MTENPPKLINSIGWLQARGLLQHITLTKDINNTENLIFIIDRLIKVDGNLEIVGNKVPLGGEIFLKDAEEKAATFTPIAVIHHIGEVVQNRTQGHYRADILDKATNQWIRTSDDEYPVIISRDEITKAGYFYLYKKVR